jgi:hypothetical protein
LDCLFSWTADWVSAHARSRCDLEQEGITWQAKNVNAFKGTTIWHMPSETGATFEDSNLGVKEFVHHFYQLRTEHAESVTNLRHILNALCNFYTRKPRITHGIEVPVAEQSKFVDFNHEFIYVKHIDSFLLVRLWMFNCVFP